MARFECRISKLSMSLQNRNAFATRLMICNCLACNVLVAGCIRGHNSGTCLREMQTCEMQAREM
jgi:hypothetical protein